ncbi:MAG: hypothetical protein KY475_05135 [Planctomycetes bacterium]|nr:hypothetical protein [Planctomycetota bacterium]
MPQKNSTKIVNQNEWRVVGMSRSGSHAVINWLLAQMDGRTCFLNCAEPKHNPFERLRPLGSGSSYVANYREFDLEQERRGKQSRKDYLIYSHEDCYLGLLRNGPWEEQHDQWIGPSASRRDILVLRDPFNLFASRIKYGIGEVPPRRAMQIWKQHARQFLGERRPLPRTPVRISYNHWFQDRKYRRSVAQELGLHFTDASFEVVPDTAGGSSFDGLRYRRRASKMKVLDRWRELLGNEEYEQLFDEEVLRLAEAIFGPLPAAEELQSHASSRASSHKTARRAS